MTSSSLVRTRWSTLLLAAATVALCGPPLAAADQNPDWKAFRDSHPLHAQVIALSRADKANQRTLLVTEPPPHVEISAIKSLGGPLVESIEPAKHRLGYDGWVTDLVLRVADDPAKLDAFISKLQRYVFRTGYKADVLELPHKVPPRGSYPLDFQVSAAELSRWVQTDGEQFTPIEGGPAITSKQLFSLPYSQVLFSAKRRGLVGWWLPKGKTVADCRTEARQFVLDSDLVLGAIADEHGTLILGRERVVPVETLPPLRVETLELLNVIRDAELAQSFERLHPVAGILSKRDDWGPIYLSRPLRDTELGSVLNIADQILKSWSNNTCTKYANFDYAPPGKQTGPFTKPAPLHLGVLKMVYNWNTRGAGYVVADGNYRVYALHRTGCLPLNYIPEGEVPAEATLEKTAAAERKAYDWFAGRNDPHLARVVQYLAFYQIFQHLPVTKAPAPKGPAPDTVDAALRDSTFALLKEIRDAKDKDRKELIAALIKYDKAQGFTPPDESLYEIVLETIQTELGKLKDEDLRAEVNRFLSRREPETEAFTKLVPAFRPLAAAFALHDRFAKKAGESARGWIHTPVVVVSGNDGELAGAKGGHNFSARVVQFKVTTEEKYKGNPDFDPADKTVILIHKDDLTKVGELARPAGMRDVSAEKMLADLRKALEGTAKVRTREEALGLPPPPPPPEGPPPPTARGMADPGGRRRGWSQGDPPPAAVLAAYKEYRQQTPRTVLIHQEPDGSFTLIYGPEGAVIKARNRDDAVEFAVLLQRRNIDAKEGEPLHFVFEGIEIEDARLFTHASRIRALDERVDPNVVGYVAGKDAKAFTAKDFEADLAKKYDFAKAEVKTVDVHKRTDGSYQLTITIEVPAEQGKLTVGERFSPKADEKNVRTYGERLKSFLPGIFGKSQSPSDLRRRILQEQAKLRKDLDLPPYDPDHPDQVPMLDIRFRRGLLDFSIVRWETNDVALRCRAG